MNRNDPFYIRTPEEFKRDISYQREPLRELTIHKDLTEKVARDGHLVPYAGDTVIYELDEDVCTTIVKMRDDLYRRCDDLLCAPLPEESFHITLHDLCSTKIDRWESRSAVFSNLENRTKEVENRLAGFRKQYPNPIRLKPTYMFNMVCKSVVLGFEPADEASHHALMDMYSQLQHVVQLSYGLTPHVTIAYYKPADTDRFGNPIRCDENAVARLSAAMQEIPGLYPLDEITVTTQNLVHRGFWDMRRYIPMEEFCKDYQDERHVLDLFYNFMGYASRDLQQNMEEAAKAAAHNEYDSLNSDALWSHCDNRPNNRFFSVVRNYAAYGLEFLLPDSHRNKTDAARMKYALREAEKRATHALHYCTEAAIMGMKNNTKRRTMSSSPEYRMQGYHDWMSAAILLNFRERRLLPKRFSAFTDTELIYYCLYEQKW